MQIEELAGMPVNPNSAFFDTSKKDEGFKFFCLKVPNTMLVPCDIMELFDKNKIEAFRFRDDSIKPVTRFGEKIGRCLFVPWRIAAIVPDIFTGMATLKLLSKLDARLDV